MYKYSCVCVCVCVLVGVLITWINRQRVYDVLDMVALRRPLRVLSLSMERHPMTTNTGRYILAVLA